MIKKLILGIFTIILFINFETAYSEIFIKAKVNNQIITNFDIKNEKNYLLALNPSLKNLPNENLNRYAIDSAINEKIKKIEIEKKYQILENNNIIQKIIKDLYSEIGISNIDEFKNYLKKYNINLNIKNKKKIKENFPHRPKSSVTYPVPDKMEMTLKEEILIFSNKLLS